MTFELQGLVSAFGERGLKLNPSKLSSPLESLKTFMTPDESLILSVGGQGKTQFALQSSALLSQFPLVELLICAGSAGALDPRLNVGDVVIATETLEHDFNSVFAKKSSKPCFKGSGSELEKIEKIRFEGFSTFIGRILSGDEDIVNAQRRAQLFQEHNALAVAWEGAGGARAAQLHRKKYLELRAITDLSDDASVDKIAKVLPKTMLNLCDLLLKVIHS